MFRVLVDPLTLPDYNTSVEILKSSTTYNFAWQIMGGGGAWTFPIFAGPALPNNCACGDAKEVQLNLLRRKHYGTYKSVHIQEMFILQR